MTEEQIFEDAFNLFCGRLIGEGIHRKVYECRIDPTLVVKVEQPEHWTSFANMCEMKFWGFHADYKPVADWLAPCHYLSPNGQVLLQQKCDPWTGPLPEKVPSFLTDLKRENFGNLDGRLVCVDYSSTIMNPSMRLKNAEWD